MSRTMIRGVDLAYERAGTGPTMIWGHGLTSSMAADEVFSLIDWAKLRTTTDVIRYDARGHGESESTADPDGYHWRELARDQLSLADALGIDTYIAGGASMGCATALHAAVLAPQRVTALLLAIPPTAWGTRAAQKDAYLANAQLVEDGDIDQLVAGARAGVPPDPFVDIPQWADGGEASIRAADRVRLARVFRGAAVADFPTEESIAGLHVPTAIFAWTGDAGHPMSTAERLVELMPHATLHVASTIKELFGWTSEAVAFLGALDRPH